ncbi:transposase [Paenibacillus arenilitoris]|uniref:Transposase n=1 Tax=Paenibacillus arenilitoris TaxID=2772299 RepID=A0A927CTX1_9BACL|nr:transposase [Paenibacillus arenilitoris]MBD2872858.1 transposase [Paenibacillus arenilitoris]
MRQPLASQPNATIYQYQLVKRISIRMELIYSYFLIAGILLAFQMLAYHMDGLFSWLIGFAIVQVVHLSILLLTFIRVDEAADRKWVWRVTPPWIGFKPANDIKLLLFRRVHRHLFWIGLCAIALLYPWIKESLMISVVSWHLWLLIPKLLLSFTFRKQKEGLLRLQAWEASFYKP